MTDKRLKIAFMGTPDFAVPALDALRSSKHEVVCVYTQPPRPKGRGQQVQPSPVHAYAEDHNIPVFTPKSLKKEEEQAIFAGHNLDVAVVAAYGLILPKAVLAAPKYGCINIHASLLPRWRGASPIQHAILAGDEETGITIMQMDEGLDTGPMLLKRAVKIHPHTTAQSLHDELAAMGSALIEEFIDELAAGKDFDEQVQDNALSTYAPLLTKDDGRVDWNKTAIEISRQVRALNPWPGVWCEAGGQRIKILEAVPVPTPAIGHIGSLCGEGDVAGTVLDKEGITVCGGRTVLKLLKVQPAGAKAMDFTSALNGGYIKPGERLA